MTPVWKQRFDACLLDADLDTPEGRHAFDNRLRATLGRVYPKTLRLHYEAFFRRERARVLTAIDGQMGAVQ